MFTCILNKNMHGDDDITTNCHLIVNLPRNTCCFTRCLCLTGLDLNNQINVDKSSIKMVLLLTTSAAWNWWNLGIYSWFAANAPRYEVVASNPSPDVCSHWRNQHGEHAINSAYHLSAYLWPDDLRIALGSLGRDQPSAKHCPGDYRLWFVGAYLR